jgi:Flp pilus assembly protein TadD
LLRGSDYAPAEAPPATDEFRLFLETHFLAYERRRLATSPGDKARSVRIAVALLGSGQPQAALDLLVHVGNEGGFWVDQCRALALAKTSRLAEAEAILQAHIVHSPQDHRPELALGRLLLDSSRFGEAREVLRRAIEKPDADAITFNDCGVATLACGDARSALGLFRKALRRDPRCLEASNNIGVCLQLRSSSERATQAFETALAIEPSCAVVLHNLAESFILRNDFDGAIELLERHRRSAPRDLVALESLAWAYGCTGNHARVVEVLEDAAEVSGNKNACILNNLAVALVARNRAGAAEKAYRRAIELDPLAPALRINFAHLLATLERWNEILAVLPNSESIRKSPDALVLRAQALISLSAYQDAAALLWQAHKAFPSDRRFVVWLSFVLISPLGEVSEGIALLQDAVQQWPDDLLMANNLAYALLKDGQFAQARLVLEPHSAKMLAEEDPAAFFLQATWGLLRIREGAYEEGMRSYQRVSMHAQGPVGLRLQQKMLVERGRKELEDGRTSEARASLKKAAKGRDPEFLGEARALLLEAGDPSLLPN